MATQIVNARIDTKLKKEVDAILEQVGLTGSQAIRLFYAQIRNDGAVPITLVPPRGELKEEVKQALRDVDNYISGKERKNFKTFKNTNELMNYLVSEEDE